MTKEAMRVALGERLQEARKAADIETAVEAARITGIHVQSVRDHEAGRRGADVEHLDTYARKYRVNLEWLATGRGQMRYSKDTIDFWAKRLDRDAYREVVDFARFKAPKDAS